MTIRLLNISTPMEEPADPRQDRVVTGSPRALAANLFESGDGRMSVGTWRCTPGRWRVEYDETEYCRVIEGEGTVVDETSREVRIGPGDEFVIPAGFRGEWAIEVALTKLYVIVA